MPFINSFSLFKPLAPVIFFFVVFPLHAQQKNLQAAPAYSPPANVTYPTHVYWGDTHLHTMNSVDAAAYGDRLGPEEAYRFAKGEEVVTSTGQKAKLARPLDFLVVADHSDNMGFFTRILRGDVDILDNPTGKRWVQAINKGGKSADQAFMEIIISAYSGENFPAEIGSLPGTKAFQNVWQSYLSAADEANQPGKFTAFIGYEWTSMPGGNNLHRIVMLRDDAKKASQVEPFTTMSPGSDNPRDLWQWMADYEAKTGGSVLAIPHNGNLSNGLMFATTDTFINKPLDKSYAKKRARWEPVYEVTQIKGDGEAHPTLSPNDEFADFGNWDWSNIASNAPKTSDMLPHEYARPALQLGLQLEQTLGVNPFKFGMIGSTDSHTSLATADNNNFFGKFPIQEPAPTRLSTPYLKSLERHGESWNLLASGYAGVWATENTREALFDALMRKEVYATTGPRITVRFFGGWDYVSEDAFSPNLAEIGYRKGVPMGGDLSSARKNKAPTFLVAASRDPMGANLDRIQIVKGWLNAEGERQEQIYDVAWSGNRKPNRKGKLPVVGNTVDLRNATWTNTIGAPELMTVWSDPDFDPGQRAVYYARILQIPTPNWPVYDAVLYGLELPKEATLIHQERAYTSPIWYVPSQATQ